MVLIHTSIHYYLLQKNQRKGLEKREENLLGLKQVNIRQDIREVRLIERFSKNSKGKLKTN